MNGRKLLGLLAILFALKLAYCAADAPAVPQTNTVLLLGECSPKWFKLPAKVSQELKALGIETAWRNTLRGITPEYLRQFNVVVLYYNDIAPKPNDEIKQVLSHLRAYSQEGGGLLIFKDLYIAQGMSYWQELLPPLGTQILNEQIIESDPSNVWRTRFASPGNAGWSFGWTDVIEKHPATEGVEGLAYPLERYEPGEPGAITFKTDANWKILVRTKPTAASFLPDPAANARGKVTGPGTYPSSVPLLAVRDAAFAII
ncbi:MAG: hypothetical protein KKD33_05500, partial [Verrucomicrobia bacterium]|nr:hypothetical protein [Verrucomicrobiota bacterium]